MSAHPPVRPSGLTVCDGFHNSNFCKSHIEMCYMTCVLAALPALKMAARLEGFQQGVGW